MNTLPDLLEKNRLWAEEKTAQDPDFFKRHVAGQQPKYLWVGCADSRVPAAQVMGLEPGEIFVHRNVANVVNHTDLNMLSVLQYAVEVLKVEHVIVCGHYGCGGVAASQEECSHGMIDNWLRNIRDVVKPYQVELDALEGCEKARRLCEVNVIGQAENMSATTVVQEAWRRGQKLEIHGWIYHLENGRVTSLIDPMGGAGEC